MYSIGVFAKQSQVSIRTLHHYDEIGLLPPSATTEGGHRLYTEEDLKRLQQISILKRLNFSLKEIQAILDYQQDWEGSLREQLKMIREEKRRLEQMESLTEAFLRSYEVEGKADWDILFHLTRLSQRDPQEKEALLVRLLSPEEKAAFDRLPSLTGNDPDSQEWLELMKQIKAHLHEKPESERVQAIIHRMMVKADAIFQGDQQLSDRFWELRKNPDHTLPLYPLDPELVQFIDEATIIWERHQQKKSDSPKNALPPKEESS